MGGIDILIDGDVSALEREWNGRVFVGPPVGERGLVMSFVEKLIREKEAGRLTEAVLLVNNSMETKYGQLALKHASAECLKIGRIKLVGAETSPAQGQVFFYFGNRIDLFKQEFKELGAIRRPLRINPGTGTGTCPARRGDG